MKNKILAIELAPAAIPPKPNTAATMAIIKKMTAQRNISIDLKGLKMKLSFNALKISCQYLLAVKNH